MQDKHYEGVSPLTYLNLVLSKEAMEGFLVGNIIKYLSRMNRKGTKNDDIRKAYNYTLGLYQLSTIGFVNDKEFKK